MSGEDEFGLVMPFIVTTDNGGPYDPDAFVAGIYYGEAQAIARMLPLGAIWQRYVPLALAPQLDLLAMHEGVQFRHTPWADDPDSHWTLAEMQQVPFDDGDDQ